MDATITLEGAIEYQKTIASRVKALRIARGISMAQAANAIQKSIPSMSQKESGKISLSPWEIKRLSERFGINETSIYNEQEFRAVISRSENSAARKDDLS